MSVVTQVSGSDRRDLKIEKLEADLFTLKADLAEAAEVAGRLSAVFERCPDAIFIKDLSGSYLLANPATAAFLGIEVDQLIGSTDNVLFDADAAEEIRDVDQFVVASSLPFRYQARRVYRGRERVIQTTKWPLLRDGAPAGVIGVARDVTSLSLDEEARNLQGAVAKALILSDDTESAMAELPDAIRGAFDAEAVIRWRLAGPDGELACVGLSVANTEFCGRFIDECRKGISSQGELPAMLLASRDPLVLSVADQSWTGDRAELMEQLDLKTVFGFSVNASSRKEVFEVFLAERRAAVPSLLENLADARDLIEGALSREG